MMLKIERLIRSIPRRRKQAWDVTGNGIRVEVRGGSRHQAIWIERLDDLYVFTSVVLGTRNVTKSIRHWRRLALLVWERNARHQLVTFGFDRKDRQIGQIQHQAEFLDPEELELYVNTLARECDRFEYLLTGKDAF